MNKPIDTDLIVDAALARPHAQVGISRPHESAHLHVAGEATYIDTEPAESLQIQNGGLNTLQILSVTRTGDSAFRLDGPLKTELKGKETTFLRVFFKPTEVKKYQGALLIKTNAESVAEHPAEITIQLAGEGVRQP